VRWDRPVEINFGPQPLMDWNAFRGSGAGMTAITHLPFSQSCRRDSKDSATDLTADGDWHCSSGR
jgi:hypothetical protein